MPGATTAWRFLAGIHLQVVLDGLRLLGAALWSIPIVVLGGSVYRVIRHRAERYDEIRSLLFFVAANSFGYSIRGLFFPDSVGVMIGLRLLSILVAVATIMLVTGYRRAGR